MNNKKLIRVLVMSRKTKEGKSFPVYRVKTLKGMYFECVFGKNVNKVSKSCVIEIDEDKLSMGYKQDKDKQYIKDKNGNKIPQVYIMGDYNIIKDEYAPKELQPKKLIDEFKEMF